MKISTVGINLAKQVFQVHGVAVHGKAVLCKKLERSKLLDFFVKLPPCLVGMAERDVEVDHATVHRWALKVLPVLVKVFRRRKRPVGRSWRMDETYIRVGGQWKYLYRAVDKLGHTVDFLLAAKRDHAAARRFIEPAIGLHDVPEKITIDKSGANTAAVHSMITDSGVEIELRQSNYLNNLIEQDHCAVKRRTRPMLGFKDFYCAAKLIAGIETMHMIKKGQLDCPDGEAMSAAEQFYSLAF